MPNGTQIVIEPRRGWLGIDWPELWRHRELLYFLTWRDLKVRYRQTVLGALWAILRPLLLMVVFSVIFGRLAGVSSEGYPYSIFVYAGLLPWQFFSDALQRSSNSVVGNHDLITKVYFPRLIIPVASVGSVLVDLALSFLVLGGILAWGKLGGVAGYEKVVLGPGLLMLPFLVLWTAFIALGVGLLFSALNVAYRDFRYVVPFAVHVWMFLTPVIWSGKSIPPAFEWLVYLNPVAGIVDGYRSAILGKPFAAGDLTLSMAMALVAFVVGMTYFRRIERQFADII